MHEEAYQKGYQKPEKIRFPKHWSSASKQSSLASIPKKSANSDLFKQISHLLVAQMDSGVQQFIDS